ncbi:MAG: type II secretion system F family protein [Pseudoruegeria sp.]
MHIYKFKGLSQAGNLESGELQAESVREANRILNEKGVFPFEITESNSLIKQSILFKNIEFQFGSPSLAEQSASLATFSTLINAGIPVEQSLSIVKNNTSNRQLSKGYGSMREGVVKGNSLEEVLSANNQIFPRTALAYLKIGARSNRLAEAATAAEKTLTLHSKIRSKIIAAISYPVVLFISMLALLAVMVFFMAPNLALLFEADNRPLSLRILIFIGDVFQKWWPILAGLFSISSLLVVMLTRHEEVQKKCMYLALKLPWIGVPVAHSHTARIASSLSEFMKSGLTLEGALRELKELDTTNVFCDDIELALNLLKRGEKASTAFDRNSDIPKLFLDIFKIGEETGELQPLLARTSTTFSEIAERQILMLTNFLTPLMTLIAGVCIGTMVFSLMSAIMNLNEIAF